MKNDNSLKISIKINFNTIIVNDKLFYENNLTKKVYYKNTFVSEIKRVFKDFYKDGYSLKEIAKLMKKKFKNKKILILN